MIESEFIALLKKMPLHDGARALADDAAVIQIGQQNLILTKDMMVEGVHYFADADPYDVAWKLLAVNLSDLAAKGATPLGVMLGFTLNDAAGDDWDRDFARGFDAALRHYDVKLLGGDTVSSPQRHLSLCAIGTSDGSVPSRNGAKNGDIIYVSGPIGDAFAGYEMVKSGRNQCGNSQMNKPAMNKPSMNSPLIMAYNRPNALLALGQETAPAVHAMMDISDGLLIDLKRMADASGLQADIILDHIPLSADYQAIYGHNIDSIIKAATWGDDYQLLCAAEKNMPMSSRWVAIGKFTLGQAITLSYKGQNIALPNALGYEH